MLKTGGQSRIVMVTCGTMTEARRMARRVVSNSLAACVNIVQSPVESVYMWKGKVEKAREYLLLMKTTAKRLAELEREVGWLHSYDVPEFIALAITEGSTKYLSWLDDNVKKTGKRRK